MAATSCLLVLLSLNILGTVWSQRECDPHSFAASSQNCILSSNCRNVTCHDLSLQDEGGSSLDYLSISIYHCVDPVWGNLYVSDEGGCSGSFAVNGVGEVRRELQLRGWQQLRAVFSRNASHLHFKMQVGASVLVWLDIPLDPSNCMCRSMRVASESITFPALIPIRPSCPASSTDCGGFNCTASVQSTNYNSRVSIDSCTEALDVNVMDASSGESVFQRSFSQSVALPFEVNVFVRPTLYVLIDHYMYSMRVAMMLEVIGSNSSILPSQQIILDRSSCARLTAFPGAPVSGSPSLQCFAPATTPYITTVPTTYQPATSQPDTSSNPLPRTDSTSLPPTDSTPLPGTDSTLPPGTDSTPPPGTDSAPNRGTGTTPPPGTDSTPSQETGTTPPPGTGAPNRGTGTTTLSTTKTDIPFSAGKSSSLAVAVTVPIILILFTVIVVMTVLGAVFIFMRLRKRRDFHFRRMAFSAMEDDDDEEY